MLKFVTQLYLVAALYTGWASRQEVEKILA